jgi:TatD DNase family protein
MLTNCHTHTIQPNVKHIITHHATDIISSNLFSIGLHPWYINEQLLQEHLQIIKDNCNLIRCMAIGECGLDKLSSVNFNTQILAFNEQIKIAKHFNKPLIIHAVKAHNQIINCLKNNQFNLPVVIHGFNQNQNILHTLLQQNYYISVGKHVLKATSNIAKLLPIIPLQNLLIETDDDASITTVQVYMAIASILNISIIELENTIENNFNTIFAT